MVERGRVVVVVVVVVVGEETRRGVSERIGWEGLGGVLTSWEAGST